MFFVFLRVCMDDLKQRQAVYYSDGVPSFLRFDDAIEIRHCIRVLEDQDGGFKRQFVLSLVKAILAFIPCKENLYIQDCSTCVVCLSR